MKKISIITLVILLVLALAACGRKNDMNTQDTAVPTTNNSILPEMDPTMDTNIPDDNVNSNSTDHTDTTDTTDATGSNNATTATPKDATK